MATKISLRKSTLKKDEGVISLEIAGPATVPKKKRTNSEVRELVDQLRHAGYAVKVTQSGKEIWKPKAARQLYEKSPRRNPFASGFSFPSVRLWGR